MTRALIVLMLAGLAPLYAGQEATPEPQEFRAGCFPDDQKLGTISLDDAVEVQQAFAGGEKACYRVALTRGGQRVTGYVLGDALPAVKAFVKQQEEYRDAAFVEQLEQAQKVASPPVNARPAPKPNPDTPASFEEFGGRDISGKPVSLSGLGGRVILVTFWSPRSAASKRQLLALLPLYNQYKRAGLRAVGISMDPNPAHVAQALNDITLGWPQMPDRNGLAARYGANPSTGTTLVLDASHHILAAGLTPSELEKKIRELLADRNQ